MGVPNPPGGWGLEEASPFGKPQLDALWHVIGRGGGRHSIADAGELQTLAGFIILAMRGVATAEVVAL